MLEKKNLLEYLQIQLDKELNEIVPKRNFKSKLFHYTDFNGLKGIVENQYLFATNSSFLNDKKEYSYGVDIFIKAAEKVKNEKSSEIRQELARQLLRLIKGKTISNHYVTSFSSKGDLLSQWRAYANNGKGISIGFDAGEMNKAFIAKAQGFFVKYKDQESIADRIFKACIDFFEIRKEIIQNMYGIDLIEFYKISSNQILETIDDFIGLFKDEAFREEKEYRFDLTLDKDVNKNRGLLFRSGSNNLLTPYLTLTTNFKDEFDSLKESDEKIDRVEILNKKYKIKLLPIKQIIIGPSIDFELNKKSIELLLSKHNYNIDRIDIIQSKVPYRI